MLCRAIFLCAFLTSILTHSQTKNNDWQIGVGGALTVFSKSDASFIGDRAMVQIPRLNLTMPINNNFSVDGALSFNTVDLFVTNSVKYFSMDGSLRYSFNNVLQNFYPYVFAGGSLVDSERKMTPTLNLGAGATYWISDSIGLNTQLYYKHSFEGYQSMRSHIQVTGGFVFVLNFLNRGGSSRSSRRIKTGATGCYFNQMK